MWSLFPEIAWEKRKSHELFYQLKFYNLIWILFMHWWSTNHKDKIMQDKCSVDFPFLQSVEYKELL